MVNTIRFWFDLTWFSEYFSGCKKRPNTNDSSVVIYIFVYMLIYG